MAHAKNKVLKIYSVSVSKLDSLFHICGVKLNLFYFYKGDAHYVLVILISDNGAD